jgi:hypothetical protein
MHMKLNGASKTLIRLIEGVLPISHLYNAKSQCHDSKATATQPLSRPRPQRSRQTSPLSPPLMRWIAAWRSSRSEWRPFIEDEAVGRFTMLHAALWCVEFLIVFFQKRACKTNDHSSWGPLFG